jgi:RimJ/RimL family protein N-acetyltransferase
MVLQGRHATADDRDWLTYHRCVYACGDGLGCLAVILREGNRMIGEVGLEAHLAPDIHGRARGAGAELSYRLGQEFWGFGYATEACQVLLRYGFGVLRLSQVAAATKADNVRSVNLLQRLGFDHPVPFGLGELYAVMESRNKI